MSLEKSTPTENELSDEFDPRLLGDVPADFVQNEDGSVTIPDEDSDEPVDNAAEFFVNLAESFDAFTLNAVASELVELVEKDKQAREKRDKQYEEGIRRTGLGNDAPGGAQFDGASRVVHPVMAEACVDFASSAIKELFPPSGPVKADHIGIMTKEQTERGQRKTELMNWQLTKQMPEYYDELEQLLSQLPLGGAQYMKLRPDEALKRPVVEFLPIDEILLPYSATSFYTAQRVTHRQLITRATFEQRVDKGFYREMENLAEIIDGETPEQTSSALATDKVEGVEDTAYNEDGLRAVLEMYVWRDFDEDGLTAGNRAPYVIHIDEHTEKVLAIYRNWDEEDSTFEKLDWIVEWKFIPWRGAYGIGLPHLIGGLSAALTGALRAILDSAHINNAPSMLKMKGARGSVGSNTQVQITEVTEIECPPNTDDIRKVAMPMPFNPPSVVLFQLLGFLQEAAKGVVSTAEEKISEAGNNMPVGTAMALIEQGSKVFSAIHARMHRSQAKTLEILHRINAKWLDEEQQVLKLGKVVATRQDFIGSMDVLPASDPHVFSETQRYAQIQAVMQMSQDQTVPWNKQAIYTRMLNLMHVQQPEELLPVPPEPVAADPLTENDMMLQGKPVKGTPEQDHMAHIQSHLTIASLPWILDNPMVPPQVIQGILSHVNQHIMLLQMASTVAMAQQLMAQAQAAGVPVTPDQISPVAVQHASQMLAPKLQEVMQQMTMIQQKLQARTPPPPMDPQAQAAIQIAKMDTDRKAAFDNATIAAKQADQQASRQMEAAKLQMEQGQRMFEQQMEAANARFEQFMAAQEQTAAARAEELSKQVELLRNRQDNEQHQMTELLKNHEDNQTQIFIERMKQELAPMLQQQSAPQPQGPDLTVQMQQMQSYLDQLGKAQTNDALAAVVDGLRATIETMNKPKTLIRDASGRAQGIQ